MPRLVAAEGAAGAGEAVAVALNEAKIDAIVDDHEVWSADARRVTDTIGLVALSAVAMLGATGVAVIAFAVAIHVIAVAFLLHGDAQDRIFDR